MRGPTGIPNLLLLYLTTAGALEVIMGPSSVKVLRGQDAIIPCDVTGLDRNTAINLYWIRTSKTGSHDVYQYLNGHVNLSTSRYHVDVSEFLQGNAALHISAVQLADEGTYKCAVVNTPNEKVGDIALEVSVRPTVTLAPEDLYIELGTEKSIMCEVTNVYPTEVTIRWVKNNKDSPGCVVLERGTCTTDPVNNTDGTFNITSHLTLNPTEADDGSWYSCNVTHRSLERSILRNFTMTVTEREDNTGTIIIAVIGTLLCTLLPVLAVLFYVKVLKRAPPTLSEITGNIHLTDMSQATLNCQITNYRPNNITITVYLKRSNEQKETYICTWKSQDNPTLTNKIRAAEDGGKAVHIDMEERGLLVNEATSPKERPLQLEVVPVISKGKLGLLSCQCALHITPSYDMDKGAELSVRVTHPAMTSPAYMRTILHVVGVAPKLLEIMTPGCIVHGEQVSLTCPIIGFRPQALTVTWLRREADTPETELVTWNSEGCVIHRDRYLHNLKVEEHSDKSYSFLSALTLRASVTQDNGVTYICKTFHHATGQMAEKSLDMGVIAAPVVDHIQKIQEVVLVGEPLDLTCRIHSFFPRDIQVTWYTEDGVQQEAHTGDILEDNNGLHHVSSRVTYTPTIRDIGKTFRCKVQHGGLASPKHRVWTLSELVSPPIVGDIQSNPADPMSLSCTVRDMYPAPQQIQWYRGLTKLPSDPWEDAIKPDPTSKIYSGTIKLKLSEECGGQIILEIIHSANTIRREFTVILEGLPSVSEISMDPPTPEYGKPLILSCSVTDCDPRNIAVAWSEAGRALGRGESNIRNDGAGSISCTLRITPTAKNYGKSYSCYVTHKDKTIMKTLHLRLPDIAPTLSNITVCPKRLKANQEASFCITISSFSPRDIQVKWFRGFSQFPGSTVTSSEPQIGDDCLYTCSSTLKFTPTARDDRSDIRCEVLHRATKKLQERRQPLDLSGVPDSPDSAAAPQQGEKTSLRIEKIECRPERPRVGEQVTLVGRVAGCEAGSPMFSWYRGMFPIDGGTEWQDATACTSTITFTTEPRDAEQPIRLEVQYNYQNVEETYLLSLG